MKKLIICVFVLMSIGGCLGMQQSAPDDQSTPDVSEDQDIPEVPVVPEMPSYSGPDVSSQRGWATGMYDTTVSHIPEINSSAVGRGSNNWECCGNFERFKVGSSQCRHRLDCLFALTGGCCCGLWCLDRQGRLMPVLYLERCCSNHRSNTPLEQIPDDTYAACSHMLVNGCVCSVSTVSLILALLS